MVDVVPGQWLGDWVVEERLGQGGFAVVHRARHAGSGQRAAIKVPTDPRLTAHFARQERALALEHPHVVRTLAAELDHDPPFLVLELVEGGNLRELLREGPLEPARALEIVREIAAALDHAHRAGVVHLDVKPENVLLEAETGRVRLTDFGAAGDADAPQLRQSLAISEEGLGTTGTRDYSAPEVRYGDAEIDRRADVYALAVLTYELLTGRLPLGLDRPSQLRPGLPVQVDEVLARALAREPERRTLSAGALAGELASALSGTPLEEPADAVGGGWGWALWALLAGALLMALVPLLSAARAPRAAESPRTPHPRLEGLLGGLLPDERVGLLPVEDLGSLQGWAPSLGLTLAREDPHGRLVELWIPQELGPADLYERAVRSELTHESRCRLAIHAVLPPGYREPLDDGLFFLVDLPSYAVRAATPVTDPEVERIAEWVASTLRRARASRPLVVLPTVDAELGVSNRWAAAFDARLSAALAGLERGPVPLRARAGIVSRLRAFGGDARRALAAELALSCRVDAGAGQVRCTLRDLASGEALVEDEVLPLDLSGYDPHLGARRFSVAAPAPEEEGAPILESGMERASAHLYRGEEEEAIAVLESLRAGDEVAAGEAEPLLLLARAHREGGTLNRALQLYEEGMARHPDDARFPREFALLCLSEAERLYSAGKRPWYANDDEALFREARAMLARVEELPLDDALQGELQGFVRRLEGEM